MKNKKQLFSGQLFLVVFALAIFVCSLAVFSAKHTEAANSPLRVLSSNPRYFTDGLDKAIYLTGSHERNNFQNPIDGDIPGGMPRLDFNSYLAILKQHNHNFIRLWAWENAPWDPLPYVRTGSGTANDGKLKFNLNQFNQTYFDELRSRVVTARNQGFYVGVMLFQGWSIMNENYEPGYVAWDFHPMHRNNNVNGIDGDLNRNGEGEEVHTLQSGTVNNFQKAYVRKVIDTLNDLDNIIWEISNESLSGSAAWQYEMINYIKSYEAAKSKQHLVWMTAFWDHNDAPLFSSPADVVSPRADGGMGNYRDNPPAADGKKIIINDTDHLFANNNERNIVWKSFTRGLHPIVIDGKLNGFNWPLQSGYREAMGHTLTYANKMNLAAMIPSTSACSTAYCLVNSGTEYLVYQPGSGVFFVNLPAKTYSYEWFNPATGQVAGTGTVTSSGGNESFTPSFSGDAVLYLKAGADSSIPSTPSDNSEESAILPPSDQPGSFLEGFWDSVKDFLSGGSAPESSRESSFFAFDSSQPSSPAQTPQDQSSCPEGLKLNPETNRCEIFNPATGQISNTKTFPELARLLIQILLGFAGAIAVLFVMIGGYRYISSRGNEEAAEAAKKTLTYAAIGLFLIVFAFALVAMIEGLLK